MLETNAVSERSLVRCEDYTYLHTNMSLPVPFVDFFYLYAEKNDPGQTE